MSQTASKQTAEAFVLTREEPLPLRYRPRPGQPVVLSSRAAEDHPDRTVYEPNRDYTVDYEAGTLRRTPDSRVPDWSRHVLCGVDRFDHTLYPDYSNLPYTVYADYEYMSDGEENEAEAREGIGTAEAAPDAPPPMLLRGLVDKLMAGEDAVYVVYGDSISAGGEASEERFAYFHRWAALLRSLYPGAGLRVVNRSIGGETSEGGAGRVREDVLPLRPDVVTIGYGMNDQNLYDHGLGVPLAAYERNIRCIVDTIREDNDRCGIVLVTPCEPNPRWRHTSGEAGAYADALRRLGEEYDAGVADAHAVWTRELAAGKTPESLLLNNINHPNDYGHYLYDLAFAAMMRPFAPRRLRSLV